MPARHKLHLIASLVAVLGCLTAPALGEPRGAAWFTFRDPQIVESSGVALSSVRDDLVFTHNDSGDSARFFAVDGGSGCTIARFNLTGATAVDWEDMETAPGPHGGRVLWFADVGDNAQRRPSVSLYAVPEPVVEPDAPGGPCPAPAERDVRATRFDLRYPDGAHDSEALFADQSTGRLYVVTKAYLPTQTTSVYAAPPVLSADAPNVLEKVTDIDLPPAIVPPDDPVAALPLGVGGKEMVTGASMAGDAIVLRTYAAAYVWRLGGRSIGEALGGVRTLVELPSQPQGEAIAFTRDGNGVVVTSEDPLGTSPPVYRVPVPA